MTDVRAILDFPDEQGRAERLRFDGLRRIISAEAIAAVRPALRAAEEAARNGE
jgi:hypothetical protein